MPLITKEKKEKRSVRKPAPVSRVFAALAADPSNLPSFLESLYTTRIMRDRHPEIRTVLIADPALHGLARECGLFDEIRLVGKDVAHSIRDLGPDIVYVPSPDIRLQLKLFFSGALRIAGGSRLGKLFLFYDMHNRKDIARLKGNGVDLMPGVIGLNFVPADAGGPHVYLGLFGEHNVSGAWPVGHAARLARLLAQINLKLIVPLPVKRFQRFTISPSEDNSRDFASEIQYLRKYAPEIQFADSPDVGARANLMRKSCAVIAPAGPETVFAGLLRRPVITLHDMQSHRYQGRPENRRNGETSRRMADSGVLPYFQKIADSMDKHLLPQVEECIENCPACVHLSCVDTISPERVFENVKRLTLPY